MRMRELPLVRQHAAKVVTLGIVAGLYLIAVPDAESIGVLRDLATPLQFRAEFLAPAENGRPMQAVRPVHPALKRLDAWISSVGSGVALADIAGSGLPADICLVDPRNDSLSVMPAPETGERFKPFALAAPTGGYRADTTAPMGCLADDVNEDGWTDIIAYYWGRTPLVFLREPTADLGQAAFKPQELVAGNEIWNTNAAILSDVDGDGHSDLVFGNYYADGAQVLDPTATADFRMQRSMSRAFNGGRNRLLLWQSATKTGVTYGDASGAFTTEMADGWTLALAARDLNGDAKPEIYVANDFGPDRLLLNKSHSGRPKFELVAGSRDFLTPRSKVLGGDSFKGMGVDFGDLDGDGRSAIAVSNIASPYALLESHFLFVNTGDVDAWNRGIAPYRDQSGPRGTWTTNWAWDIKFADLINSGRPALLQAIGFLRGPRSRWPELQELATGNDELLSLTSSWPQFTLGDDLSGRDHDRMMLPDLTGRFHDLWATLGLGGQTTSRGIAVGDVFGDCRLAVAVSRQWQPSLFLRNLSATGEAVEIDLRVRGQNGGTRPAIGAEARITLPDGRIVTSLVDGGNGHGGKRAPWIHLGLGPVPVSQPLDVAFVWRDPDKRGAVQRQSLPLVPGRYRIILDDNPEVTRTGSCRTEKGGSTL